MYRAYEEDVFPDECSEHMNRGYEDDVSRMNVERKCIEHMKKMFPSMNVYR